MKCQYCNKVLSSKSALNHHQKTTKSCLVIQNKSTDKFKCICGATFSAKSVLVTHKLVCRGEVNNKEIETENQELKNQLEDAQSKIKHLEAQLQLSEKITDHYFKLTETLANTPTTTNNTINNTIKVENLNILDTEKFEEYSSNLTLEHILRGAKGYAQYAIEYPLKNKLYCSNYKDRITLYKNPEGQIITDPKLISLMPKFFTSILKQNQKLTDEHVDSINEKHKTQSKPERDGLSFEVNRQHNVLIVNLADGKDNKFGSSFIEAVCAFSKVQDPWVGEAQS